MDANEAMARAWAYRVNMMRLALSIVRQTADAEDAVSAAMLSACQGAPALRDERTFTAWIMRILTRSCYDLLRRRQREVPTEDMAAYDGPGLAGTEGTVFEAIQTLPEAYHRVLVLHYYEGFKAREIAHILSVPLGTVLVRLSRGRDKLKFILHDMEEAAHEQTAI